MNIVFNTKYKGSAASMFYIDALKDIKSINFFKYNKYHDYDIALFMTYEEDLLDLKEAKISYPNLRIGLVDPRGSAVDAIMEYVDFLVVDSIEMKDFFAKYSLPTYTYYEYPNIDDHQKYHKAGEKIIIGYHGNKVHLTAMYPEITKALELLAAEYSVELWVMYNIEALGVWNIGLPQNVKVKHIQWSMDNYHKYLSKVDIGIVPACMPINAMQKVKRKSIVSRFFLDNDDDYIIKFKMPSNPGRIIVFSKLGIPVVADLIPSNIQFIRDGENGFLAYSAAGWYNALAALAESAVTRQEFSDNMKTVYEKYFDYGPQNIRFLSFLEKINKQPERKKRFIGESLNMFEKIKFRNAYLYNLYSKYKGKFL